MASRRYFDNKKNVITIANGNTAEIVNYALQNGDAANIYGNIQCKNSADPPDTETFVVREEYKKGSGNASRVGGLNDLVDNLPDGLGVSISKNTDGNNARIQITNNSGGDIEVQYNINIDVH